MPRCTQCLVVRALDEFAEAQLRKPSDVQRCLRCSNPRLFAQKKEAGLEGEPLMALGRSRPQKQPGAGKDGTTRACTCCQRELPLAAYSTRQLSKAGKGRCPSCAVNATAENCKAHLKRQHSAALRLGELDCSDYDDSDDEAYTAALLRDVEAARPPKRVALDATSSRIGLAPDEANVGHRLLTKMGWAAGMGLGAEGMGETTLAAELLASQRGTAGLGHGKGRQHVLDDRMALPKARPVYPEELSWCTSDI